MLGILFKLSQLVSTTALQVRHHHFYLEKLKFKYQLKRPQNEEERV